MGMARLCLTATILAASFQPAFAEPNKTISEHRIAAIEKRLDHLEVMCRQGAGLNDEAKSPSKKTKTSPITADLLSKGFSKMDIISGQGTDLITLTVAFHNSLEKDVRAFNGTILFNDLFDKEIMSSPITIDSPIKAGDSITWNGGLNYNQFIDSNRMLLSKDKSDLHVQIKLDQVMFEDGSKQSF